MKTEGKEHRSRLAGIAYQAMLDRGLLPDFSAEALVELDKFQGPAALGGKEIRDLRWLLWASIDNDDSDDLDQLSVAEVLPDGKIKVLVAIADVDALVVNGSAIDDQARYNTTSVYTAARIFPMLPEKLSTDLTSLNFNEDRLSIVIEMVVNTDGSLHHSDIYRAVVRNHAQLAYNSVAAWLAGNGSAPDMITIVDGLAENLRLQDQAAQHMQKFRQQHGALSFETIETKPRFDGEQIQELEVQTRNRTKEMIKDFMIAANAVVARFLAEKKYPSIQRVVRTPKRWERIVELADEHGFSLPGWPDPIELEKFLKKQKAVDPLRFPDLSLSVIKLMGAGEYVADMPDDPPPGHFGLAEKDYTHSTAPNRRYTDLLMHRMLKAALESLPFPYTTEELDQLAKHCTKQENAAKKVERQVSKSAAALLLEARIGEHFDAMVTGASPKGVWVRLLNVPVEGKLEYGYENMDVGQRTQVQLISVDVERGFIDFKRIG